MNFLFSLSVLAMALQPSLQDGIWPKKTALPPQSPPTTAQAFPAISTLSFNAFCTFAGTNCPRYRASNDLQLCKLSERICVLDFDTNCPSKLAVCKNLAKLCTEKKDTNYQDICKLQANSCSTVQPVDLPTPTSTNVTVWCQTIKTPCNPTGCQSEHPNCALFRMACTADSKTDAQRTKMFCNCLLEDCNKQDGDKSIAACSNFGTFKCADVFTPKPTQRNP